MFLYDSEFAKLTNLNYVDQIYASNSEIRSHAQNLRVYVGEDAKDRFADLVEALENKVDVYHLDKAIGSWKPKKSPGRPKSTTPKE